MGESTGLRVPIEAVHYLKEDGTEAETQGENYIPGVYVKYGNIARFCKIDPVDNDHPLVTDGDYSIVMPSSRIRPKPSAKSGFMTRSSFPDKICMMESFCSY